MNCKQVQDLLPLFVGRDLEEKRAKLVTVHLQSCVGCASAAGQYRESRQLLQHFAPPQFSEAVYSGIRQRVLREIAHESTAPNLSQRVASLFRPRITWAVATALLLAVFGFAFYFIAGRTNEPRQVSNRGEQSIPSSPGTDLTAAPSPAKKPNDGPIQITKRPQTGRVTISPGIVERPQWPQRRKNFTPVSEPRMSLAVNNPAAPSMSASAAPELNNLEPNAVPALEQTSKKTLRVEMQTNDQNIRIIWFSRQPAKQNVPGKSSKRIQEARSYA